MYLKMTAAQMVFGYSALKEQLEEYGKKWRACYVNFGPATADVYLAPIDAIRCVLRKMEEELPTLRR